MYFCLEEYNLLIYGGCYGLIKDVNIEKVGWVWFRDMLKLGKFNSVFIFKGSLMVLNKVEYYIINFGNKGVNRWIMVDNKYFF